MSKYPAVHDRDPQKEAPVIQDAVGKIQEQWVTREEFEALLDVQMDIVKALDQCVGVYARLTQDLRGKIGALRTKP